MQGYEYYAGLRRNIEKHGLPKFNRFLADLQMSGTPAELVEQTVDRVRALDAGGVVNLFQFGGMPQEIAERSLRIYAEQVLPQLQAIDPFRAIGASTPEESPSRSKAAQQ